MVGKKFNRITILSFSHKSKGKTYFNCLCMCGKKWKVSSSNIKAGAVKSCGCLRSENTSKANTKHGKSHNRIYRIWAGILKRCRDNKNKHYGGKNISYDPRWEDFRLFLLDMGEPSSKEEIDRIDPGGNYNKENCRWVGSYVQAMNKTRGVKSSTGFYGVTKKRNRYEANITHKVKRIYLGSSKNSIDCAKMYNEAAIKYHKEFAKLNEL